MPELPTSTAEGLAHYEELAVGGECGPTRNIFNWSDNIRAVYITGDPTPRQLATLERTLNELRSVGYNITVVDNEADANVIDNINIDHRTFSEISSIDHSNAAGFVVFVRRGYSILKAIVGVAKNRPNGGSPLSPEFIDSTVVEEIGHAITGLCDDTGATPYTAFSTDPNNIQPGLSPLDLEAAAIQASPYLLSRTPIETVRDDIVQVEVHLPGVGVSETTDLQVDDYQTSQPPVKEQQVDPVPFVTDAQTPLAAHEAEVTAQFQEEGLQVADERLFQIASS